MDSTRHSPDHTADLSSASAQRPKTDRKRAEEALRTSEQKIVVINLLIVADHVVRRGLKGVLGDEHDFSVFEASNAHEALHQIREREFDLVILDLDMPGMNGIDLLKEIKRQDKDLSVLVLSVYPEDQVAVRVLKAGASGFVSKETATDQLVGAIRSVLNGRKYISERVAELLITYLNSPTDEALHQKLSDREFQILCLFGEGKTIRQIAAVLYLSSPTVSTYRARILDKMEMKTTAELVRYAIQNKLSTDYTD